MSRLTGRSDNLSDSVSSDSTVSESVSSDSSLSGNVLESQSLDLQKRKTYRLQKLLPWSLLSFLLLGSFQNCKENNGINLKSTSSTDLNSVAAINNGAPPPEEPVIIPPLVNRACPDANLGTPVMGDLWAEGTSNVVTVANASSGYMNTAGHRDSNPKVRVRLLATNVKHDDNYDCTQNVQVQCTVTVNQGTTGIKWGTSTRVALTQLGNNDAPYACTIGNQTLDVDLPGRPATNTPQETLLHLSIRSQNPDNSSPRLVCIQGSVTVSVRLRSTHGNRNRDSESKTFTVNINNACPLEQKVNAGNEAEPQGAFGEAVSISGNRAAILTPGLDAYGKVNVGGVRIYEKNGSGTWEYTNNTVIPPDNELQVNRKPISVLLYGDYLFLSTSSFSNDPNDPNDPNDDTGRVWMFRRNISTNTWGHATTLTGVSKSRFGTSLAFNGSHLFVGAPGEDANGKVHLYAVSGDSLSAVSSISGVDNQSDFGASLAVSGNRLVVGAPGSPAITTTPGHFHHCSISNPSSPSCIKWQLSNQQLGTTTIPNSSRLGSSVAIKGDLVLVGARNWYNPTADPVPQVRNGLFATINLSSNVVKVKTGGAQENLGSAVDFASTSFFVGAREALGGRGLVYQYNIPEDSGNLTERYRYYATDQAPLDRLGAALAVSGENLVVGAPLDFELGMSTAGSATFFKIITP